MPDRLAKLADMAAHLAAGEQEQPVIFEGQDDLARLSQAFAQFVSHRQSEVAAGQKARLETAEALRELTDIKAALDAHSIVAITDPGGKITYVNDKFCEISKYSREELLGQDHRIINSGYHPKSFFTNLWKTIGGGNIWKGEIKNCAKDGSHYWVDTTIFPFLGTDGKPRQYVAIRTDITQRKKDEFQLELYAEELAAKNKEMETVVYIVSHDLRSPLLNVQGFGDALSRACEKLKRELAKPGNEEKAVNDVLEIEIPRALKFIDAGVKKMDVLLNGFLRFSRLGRVSLQIQKINMEKLVQGAIQALGYQIGEVDAEVIVNALPDCLGDPTLVGQVFSNLLDNALKYRSASRRCRVEISAGASNGHVVYKVEDNGLGIAAEHQPKVFELFHRLDPKKTSGEGLGLTIAQRILERQHGRIWVESELGKGARFFVSLPKVA